MNNVKIVNVYCKNKDVIFNRVDNPKKADIVINEKGNLTISSEKLSLENIEDYISQVIPELLPDLIKYFIKHKQITE